MYCAGRNITARPTEYMKQVIDEGQSHQKPEVTVYNNRRRTNEKAR